MDECSVPSIFPSETLRDFRCCYKSVLRWHLPPRTPVTPPLSQPEDVSQMATEEQRRSPRSSVRIPGRLIFDWGELEGNVENLGEGGIYFVTDTWEGPVAVGDAMTAVYTFPVQPEEPREPEEQRRLAVVLRVERYFHEGELFRSFAIRFDGPQD